MSIYLGGNQRTILYRCLGGWATMIATGTEALIGVTVVGPIRKSDLILELFQFDSRGLYFTNLTHILQITHIMPKPKVIN